MSDSKINILQRLEAGEITAEEAMNLINRLNESPTSPPPAGHHRDFGNPVDPRQINPHKSHSAHERRHHEHHEHYETYDDYDHSGTTDWVSSLVGWVGDVVEDITGDIKDWEVTTNLSDIFSGTYGHHNKAETFTSQPVLQGLTQLDLNGKNDKIEIYSYDGDCVQIHCEYDARRPDSYVKFHEENGHISLWFDDKAMRSVKIVCQVPRVHIGHIHAVTKNARIMLGGITAGDISLTTKNDGIFLESVNCGGLTANTTNDKIKAMVISGENIHLETTNSRITAEDVHAGALTLKTTNAGIKTAHLDVTHLIMKTTNTRLKLEDTLAGDVAFWDDERTLEAYTTNGGIKFCVPEGIGVNIEANTTDSKVTSEIPLYRSEGSTKHHLVGESMDYAMSGRRLRARLNTTNGSVKILAV